MSYAIARTEDTTTPPLTITPEPWTAQAACAQIGGDLWFPEPGGSTKAAKKICNTLCPVRDACLEFAVRTNQREGVWGGKAGRQIRESEDRQMIKYGIQAPAPLPRDEPAGFCRPSCCKTPYGCAQQHTCNCHGRGTS